MMRVSSRLPAAALLLCALSGCVEPLGQAVSYTVRVDIPDGLEGRVEGGVVSNCRGIEGRLFGDAVVGRLELPGDGSAAGVELSEGEYGIAARVLNEQCEVIAMGCLPVDVQPAATEFVIEVTPADRRGGCSSREVCEASRCLAFDAGFDGGPDTFEYPGGFFPSPDGAGYCCPRTYPADPCGCRRLTHFVLTPAPESCRYLVDFTCDAPDHAFRETVDEHGCPTWEFIGADDPCY